MFLTVETQGIFLYIKYHLVFSLKQARKRQEGLRRYAHLDRQSYYHREKIL